MGKFYLEHKLPDHIVDIAKYLYKQFDENGVMTFPFVQNYANANLAFTVNRTKSKLFPYSGRLLNSLVNLNFGTISYENSRVTNEGDFTISSELLKWHEYNKASPRKKKRIKINESVLENKLYISIILSVIAIVISIFF